MMLQAALCAVAGALLWLDRVYAFQFMVSRPIVMGPVLGLIMGDLPVGIAVGAALELLWLNAPPVGAYLPMDESFCTAAVTPAAAVAASYLSGPSAVGLALFAGLPFVLGGRTLDTYIRNRNQELIPDSAQDIERKISASMWKAIIRSFVLGLAALGASSAILCAVMVIAAPRIPHSAATAFSYMPSACVAIGLAGIVNRDISRPGKAVLFALGTAFILALTWII
jgi:mannose/fructose/N-acetylgalactosamine-specific phosphotransferase system component IIC